MTCKQAADFEHGDWARYGDERGQVIGHNCDGRVVLRFGGATRVVHPSRLERIGAGQTDEHAPCEICLKIRRLLLGAVCIALVLASIWTLL